MTAYLSDQSHYSMVKNIRFSGIGEDQLRIISSNSLGQLDVIELEKTIKKDINEGCLPFFVKATAGTTVVGAFDPINKIADICQKYNLWLHVDGALGGSVIFSEKYKYLISGIQRADSFALNAHKMLNVPISCSMILVKHKHHLFSSFNTEADYLYQGEINDINPGMISLQCARTNDALKLWTLWKSVGTQGLEDIVDKNFELAEVARSYIRSHSDYTLCNDEISTNICFNYKNHSATIICDQLYKQGKLMIGHGKFNDINFIRLVTINSNNTKEDILDFFKVIEENFE
jgi:sulfinoalanine decarboxylase/sulfinoalanine decarboxylase/aspartate 1-decarboxylase